MKLAQATPRVTPFYMEAQPGRRFCLLYEPAWGPCHGGIVYVHPFAEEMNKSRRMAALQAREFACAGYRVLMLDLYGCGDSDGDFADARWEIWRDDLERASAWLRRASGAGPLYYWGLRLGAVLVAAHVAQTVHAPAAVYLWQPVTDGQVFMTQFLRMRVASEMLAGAGATTGTKALRAAWAAGESVEIGGYAIAPALARAIEAMRIAECPVPAAVPVHWYEIVPDTANAPSPAAQKAVAALRERGVEVDLQCVGGEPFWTTMEIAECPQLLARTAAGLPMRP